MGSSPIEITKSLDKLSGLFYFIPCKRVGSASRFYIGRAMGSSPMEITDPLSSEARAVERAQQLLEHNRHLPFADQNPCTTIFDLVLQLQEK